MNNYNQSPLFDLCKIPGQNYGKPIEYKTVDTSTVKGIQEYEKLIKDGWKISRPGLFLNQFYRYADGK